MNQQMQPLPHHSTWSWPIDLEKYDRNPALSEIELTELDRLVGQPGYQVHKPSKIILQRLLQPIEDVLKFINALPDEHYETIRVMVIEIQRRRIAFWAWSIEEWRESMGSSEAVYSQRYGWVINARPGEKKARRLLPLLVYLLCPSLNIVPLLESIMVYPIVRKIFGQEVIDSAVQRLKTVLESWGYRSEKDLGKLTTCLCFLLLRNRSPHLEDLGVDLLESIDRSCTIISVQKKLYQISRALFALGIISRPLSDKKGKETAPLSGTDGSVSNEWLSWCHRWKKQSTLQNSDSHYYQILKVGRWLNVYHPEITSPAQWTYELSAEFVAAAIQMKVGEWVDSAHRKQIPRDRIGQPLRPTVKHHILAAMRVFLRDCQEWRWIPVQVNPHRALRIPRSIRNLIGPNPRVVDKDLWAKLLWGAMNLQAEDLPRSQGIPGYPLEMVRAIAIVWCFAALRSDEIIRLRVGCIRWQREDVMISETGETLPKDAMCFLDIPVNKTMTAYTKAVHPLVGKRINEWEQARPHEQLQSLDRKTSETVQFLFLYRGSRVSESYINRCLIPILCKKAGIPESDSRGKITSHRARATIASMLYNAKEPLDIFQLKEYLGHKALSSTQHYAKVDPTKLASKVAKAGYLEQNLTTIEVLLDQDAVMSGAAARGECWKYYDLGHGFCTNPFWAECAHRMACARCPYYRPKDTLTEQLIEGKANLVRMLEYVSLTDDEKLLVTEGIELHQELIEKLADMPTPAGPTPRELLASQEGETKVIPIKSVRRIKKKRKEVSEE